MGKRAIRKRTARIKSDPVMDQLNTVSARSMLVGNIVSMGWRLALTVLVPLFLGVQLDKKFDTAPSITLAAFFIAIFGAGLLIAKAYSQIQTEQALEDAKQEKRKLRRLLKRRRNV